MKTNKPEEWRKEFFKALNLSKDYYGVIKVEPLEKFIQQLLDSQRNKICKEIGNMEVPDMSDNRTPKFVYAIAINDILEKIKGKGI